MITFALPGTWTYGFQALTRHGQRHSELETSGQIFVLLCTKQRAPSETGPAYKMSCNGAAFTALEAQLLRRADRSPPDQPPRGPFPPDWRKTEVHDVDDLRSSVSLFHTFAEVYVKEWGP